MFIIRVGVFLLFTVSLLQADEVADWLASRELALNTTYSSIDQECVSAPVMVPLSGDIGNCVVGNTWTVPCTIVAQSRQEELNGCPEPDEPHKIMAQYGKCEICRRCGYRSSVWLQHCASTALWCGGGMYDEDGNFMPAKGCNKTSCSGYCSRGHEVVIEFDSE